VYKSIFRYVLRVAVIFAALSAVWSLLLVKPYLVPVTKLANQYLKVLGVGETTWVAPSANALYDVGVFHVRAAGGSDSLFDFKLESLWVQLPFLLSLIFGMRHSFGRLAVEVTAACISVALLDSLACLGTVYWSYQFLPDHHSFSPFQFHPFLDPAVNFLFSWYHSIGIGLIPIVLWLLFSVRNLSDIGRRLQWQSASKNRRA